MAHISGIQIEKDSRGVPAYVRINLKKHKEALNYLKEIGAIECEPEINPADYISHEEFWDGILKFVDEKNKEFFKK